MVDPYYLLACEVSGGYLQSYHPCSFDDKAVYLLDWNIPLKYSDHGLDTPFV